MSLQVLLSGKGLQFYAAVAVMLGRTAGKLGLGVEAQSWTVSADTAAPMVVPTG